MLVQRSYQQCTEVSLIFYLVCRDRIVEFAVDYYNEGGMDMITYFPQPRRYLSFSLTAYKTPRQ